MAQVHLLVPSFNAGELSPLIGSRFAVEKVQSGCRKLRNFIPHVHGPAFRRPGMEYMGASMGDDDKSSLRGFNFSTTTGFVLEFHPDGLQVWSNGLLVPLQNPVALPYSEAECAEVQLAQVNDVVYLAHPSHRPRKLVRYADDDWRLEDIMWKWPALGDENVRSDEIVTPVVTVRKTSATQLWPQFLFTGDTAVGITLSIVSADTSATSKTVHLQRWESTAWLTRATITWTTIAPSSTTYVSGAGSQEYYRVIFGTALSGAAAVSAGCIARAAWSGTNVDLPLDVAQPVSLQGVSIPAGEWQAVFTCPNPIPSQLPQSAAVTMTSVDNDAGKIQIVKAAHGLSTGQWVRTNETGADGMYRITATSLNRFTLDNSVWSVSVTAGVYYEQPLEGVFKVERQLGGGSWTQHFPGGTFPFVAGETIVKRGATLAADTNFRLSWNSSVFGMSAGVMKLESLVFPANDDVTLEISVVDGPDRTLTASEAIFTEGHIGSFWQIAHRRESGYVEIVAAVTVISAASSTGIRVQGHWDVFTYGVWEAELFLEKKVSGAWEAIRTWKGNKDRNVIASGEESDEVELRLRITAGTSAAATGAAVPRFVLETTDARVYGIVQITDVGTLDAFGKSDEATVDVITALYSTDPTPYWTEGAWSGDNGYPRTVALHGQRLWFGGTATEPLRLWGSVVSDYENFRRTSLDDASVSFIPAAQQSNALQWMVSHGDTLALGTNGDEWTVGGGTERGPITPTSVQIQRRSGYGSSYLPAVLVGETVVFVQRGGRKVRAVGLRDAGLTWSAIDLTVLAEHVARLGITQMAVMHFPQTILWGVTSDGKLIGMTFEQEQNVFAWHVHETAGLVESVAVVFGSESDEVWLAVNRDGARSIERLDSRVMALDFSEPERLIYLDSAVVIELGTPSTALLGLEHLEGRYVAVLGDGLYVAAELEVIAGIAILNNPVSVAVVGLPYTSTLQPMRIEIPLRDGTAQARTWRTSRVGLYLHDSSGGQVADAADTRFETLDYNGGASALYTGEVETVIESNTRAGVDVVIKTIAPLPFNVGAIVLKGDVYGE